MSNKDMMMTLAAIVKRGGAGLTDDDKKNVIDFAKEITGEQVTFANKKCRNCVIDKAVELYKVLKDSEGVEDVMPEDGRKYHLPFGKVLNYFGTLITEQELTDTLAESIIAKGFPKSLFVVNE